MGDGLIPPTGAHAAHVLLDAVVSQSAIQSPEANVKAMQLALTSLADPDAGAPPEGDDRPGPGDVVGASVVCITWLAARLAEAGGIDLEDVVAELRDFVDRMSDPAL